MTTTIKFFGGDFGDEIMSVECNLADAAAPVLVQYDPADRWHSTQYQCADARHTINGLVDIGMRLAAQALEIPFDRFDCSWEVA